MGFITGEIVIGDGLSKPASTPAQSVRDQFCKAETPRAKVVVQKISKAHGMLDTETVRVDGELMDLNKAISTGRITRDEYYTRSNGRDGHKLGTPIKDEKPKRRAPQGYKVTPSGYIVPRPKIVPDVKEPAYIPPDITDKAQERAIAAKKAEEEEKKASRKAEFDRIKERLDFQYKRYKEKKAEHEKLEQQRRDYLNRRTKCGLSYNGHYAHSDACMVELPKLQNVFREGDRHRKAAFNTLNISIQGVKKEINRLSLPDMKEFGDSTHWITMYPLD